MFGRDRKTNRPDPGTERGIAADLGDDFYPLPLERDAEEFGAEVVEILLEAVPEELDRTITREHAEALSAEFVTMLQHAQRSEASMASLYRPAIDAPMLALLSTHIYPGDPGVGLEEWVRRECVPAGGRAEVEAVPLPIGDAFRVHTFSGPSATSGEVAVVEAVSYVFEAIGGQVVHHQMSWTDADGETLGRLADWVARQLAYD